MSDYQDYLEQVKYAPPTEVWNPALHQNVNLTGATAPSPQQYIQANPDAYQNYTGAVTTAGNVPITANALVPGSAPPPLPAAPKGLGFDPSALLLAQQRMAYNPFDANARTALDPQTLAFYNAVRRIPGGNPQYGVLPGTNLYYDLLHNAVVDGSTLDPVTRTLGSMVSARPGNVPTLAQSGGPGHVFGRGYTLAGQATPEEQRLLARLQGGDTSVAPRLAQLQGPRWHGKPMGPVQEFGNKYFGPALMALIAAIPTMGVGAIGASPLAVAATGAASTGLTTGMQTNWDPKAIGIGAGAGAVSGLAGAGGQALGAGPILSGALGGTAGAGARQLGNVAAGKPVNPYDFLTGAASGAAAGALTSGLSDVSPAAGAFAKPLIGMGTSDLANWIMGRITGTPGGSAPPPATGAYPASTASAGRVAGQAAATGGQSAPRPAPPNPAQTDANWGSQTPAAPPMQMAQAPAAPTTPTGAPTTTASAGADPWTAFLNWAQTQAPAKPAAQAAAPASSSAYMPTMAQTPTYGVNWERPAYARYRYA